jgi:hypothetical protein
MIDVWLRPLAGIQIPESFESLAGTAFDAPQTSLWRRAPSPKPLTAVPLKRLRDIPVRWTLMGAKTDLPSYRFCRAAGVEEGRRCRTN